MKIGNNGSVDPDLRAQRREFIRTHHPDRGGDAEAFVAGLRRFEDPAVPEPLPPLPKVVVYSVAPWPMSLVTRIVRRLAKPPPPRVR